MSKVDITGQKFNKLTAISFSRRVKDSQYYWLFECECGKIFEYQVYSVIDGRKKSCGHDKHLECQIGRPRTKEYRTWANIKTRCLNPKTINSKDYLGRGITVCDRWLNSFKNFLDDMGRAPSCKHSIDRIDNDKGYSPDNCRWATQVEQSNNTRSNVHVTINGETKTIMQWCRIIGVPDSTIWSRIRRGRTPYEALTLKNIQTFSNQSAS